MAVHKAGFATLAKARRISPLKTGVEPSMLKAAALEPAAGATLEATPVCPARRHRGGEREG